MHVANVPTNSASPLDLTINRATYPSSSFCSPLGELLRRTLQIALESNLRPWSRGLCMSAAEVQPSTLSSKRVGPDLLRCGRHRSLIGYRNHPPSALTFLVTHRLYYRYLSAAHQCRRINTAGVSPHIVLPTAIEPGNAPSPQGRQPPEEPLCHVECSP